MALTLSERLKRVENRLEYLKDKFPEWRLCGGYGPGNTLPEYYREIRRLEEARETIILRLAKSRHLNTCAETGKAENKSENRKALVGAYIEEVFKKTGKRITKSDIWSKAGYTTRTEFERWERQDRKHLNNAADENFTRLLREKPHLK